MARPDISDIAKANLTECRRDHRGHNSKDKLNHRVYNSLERAGAKSRICFKSNGRDGRLVSILRFQLNKQSSEESRHKRQFFLQRCQSLVCEDFPCDVNKKITIAQKEVCAANHTPRKHSHVRP
jgi:hypothetical protein